MMLIRYNLHSVISLLTSPDAAGGTWISIDLCASPESASIRK